MSKSCGLWVKACGNLLKISNPLRIGSMYLLLCAFAQAASVIPFQGQLTDQAGAPLNPASAVNLVFRIYQAPTGGTASWEETQPSVVVIGGRFNVLLGSRTPFDTATLAAFNNTVYLGITVDDGNAGTTDVELRPRQAIVPVIFAENARNADQLDGFDWSSLLINKNTLAPSGDVASPDVIVPGEKVGKVADSSNADNAGTAEIATESGNAAALGSVSADSLFIESDLGYPVVSGAFMPGYIHGGKVSHGSNTLIISELWCANDDPLNPGVIHLPAMSKNISSGNWLPGSGQRGIDNGVVSVSGGVCYLWAIDNPSDGQPGDLLITFSDNGPDLSSVPGYTLKRCIVGFPWSGSSFYSFSTYGNGNERVVRIGDGFLLHNGASYSTSNWQSITLGLVPRNFCSRVQISMRTQCVGAATLYVRTPGENSSNGQRFGGAYVGNYGADVTAALGNTIAYLNANRQFEWSNDCDGYATSIFLNTYYMEL